MFLTLLQWIGTLVGASTGAFAISLFINYRVYRTPDPDNTRYPWKTMFFLASVSFLTTIIATGTLTITDQDIWYLALPLLFLQDAGTCCTIALTGLTYIYFQHRDGLTNQLFITSQLFHF